MTGENFIATNQKLNFTRTMTKTLLPEQPFL